MAGSNSSSSTDQPKKGQSVKYVGSADVREISAADFKSVGVPDQDKVSWSKENGFVVKDLPAKTVEFLEQQSDFEVV